MRMAERAVVEEIVDGDMMDVMTGTYMLKRQQISNKNCHKIVVAFETEKNYPLLTDQLHKNQDTARSLLEPVKQM